MVEEKEFKLWYFPAKIPEENLRWNPDKILFANLAFTKSNDVPAFTTVKARLPLEARLGDLTFLFVTDYNQNRSPESPIKDLGGPGGSYGWIFFVKKSLGRVRVLDPEQTIEDNGIIEDSTVILRRKNTPEAIEYEED